MASSPRNAPRSKKSAARNANARAAPKIKCSPTNPITAKRKLSGKEWTPNNEYKPMGSAYYIVLEKKIDGLDTSMDGKSVARHIDSLDEAAKKFGSPPPVRFL